MNHSTTIEKNDIDSIAIGHFDGIHKGHEVLINKTIEY
ncbi:MAG: bifunctional riboflavin kinase/FAD synthetase, partial [Campylobacter hyointestinalis]